MLLRRLLPAVAMAGVVVAGCSGADKPPEFEQPPTSAFKAGSCATMAPHVLSIGRDARRLGKGPTPPADLQNSLKTAQEQIRAAQPTLDAGLKAPVQALVTAVGVVRLSAVTGSFTPTMGTELSAAYDGVIKACTT